MPGLFVLTLKGSAAMAFESYRDKDAVLSRFANTVIRVTPRPTPRRRKAGNAGGKRWPHRAFWLPRARPAMRRAPIYAEVGKGSNTTNVVLPVNWACRQGRKRWNWRFYCGGDLLTCVNELYDAAADWRAAWENLKPGAVEGNGGRKPTPPPTRNARPRKRTSPAAGLCPNRGGGSTPPPHSEGNHHERLSLSHAQFVAIRLPGHAKAPQRHSAERALCSTITGNRGAWTDICKGRGRAGLRRADHQRRHADRAGPA